MSLMHRRKALVFLAALSSGPLARAQSGSRAFGGSNFAPTAEVAGHSLLLNGSGVRYKAMFQVYAAGLYLEQLANTPEGVLQTQGPKRISATLLRTINATELGNLFTKGILDNNPPSTTTQLLSNVARMSSVFTRFRMLEAGESFSVDLIPGKGMVLVVKGEPQHEPFEEAFFEAMLNIWLGPKPADRALKQALLGSDPYTRATATDANL